MRLAREGWDQVAASSVLHYVRESLQFGVCFLSLKALPIDGGNLSSFKIKALKAIIDPEHIASIIQTTVQQSNEPNWTAARHNFSRTSGALPKLTKTSRR